MKGFAQVNLFELSRGAIRVSYPTTNILGGPFQDHSDYILLLI